MSIYKNNISWYISIWASHWQIIWVDCMFQSWNYINDNELSTRDDSSDYATTMYGIADLELRTRADSQPGPEPCPLLG